MTNRTYKVQEFFQLEKILIILKKVKLQKKLKEFTNIMMKKKDLKLLILMTREQKNQEKKILLLLRKQKRILKIMRDKQTAWLIIFL